VKLLKINDFCFSNIGLTMDAFLFIGFQEKHAVVALHGNQMRLP
jgi:hypothetical protein